MIHCSRLRHNLVRWLLAYLCGRKASFLYQQHHSPSRHVRVGIPQGFAIFPALFNHFVSDCPIPDLDITSYADDFTLLASAPSIVEAETRANQLCSSLVRWADSKQFPYKSSVTLFTSEGSNYRDRLPSKRRDVPPQRRDCGHLLRSALRTVFSAVLCQRPPTLAPQSFIRHLPSLPPPRVTLQASYHRILRGLRVRSDDPNASYEAR